MATLTGILGADPDYETRLATSLEDVAAKVSHLRGLGQRVVLTSGSFDLIHLGHVKYLEAAKARGDFLVVGVDSDAKIRRRKSPDRPMVPERERLEMLAYQRPVGMIYLKGDDDERWGLIRAVKPDVLVLTADHAYPDDDLAQLEELCGRVDVLERQSGVTTSERIRQMHMNLGHRLGPALGPVLGHAIGERLEPILADLLPDLINDLNTRR